MNTSPTTASDAAVLHILKRIKADPRLAFLIGPGSESFDLLMKAGAAIGRYDVVPFQLNFLSGLITQPVPCIGQEAVDIDPEFLHRMSVINDGVLNLDDLVNHFIGLGLQAEEARRDAQTEELF